MNEQTQVLIAQLTKQAKETVDSVAWKEMINLVAKEKFIKYNAYVEAGFSEAQAIEMIIREGV